jgi:hypothetical protein
MPMLIAWVVYPVLLAAVSLGCGLALERAAGVRLPASLMVPLGLAVIVALSALTTAADATAELTAPVVIVAAVAGFALPQARPLRSRLDPWAAAASVGVFAVFAAPTVLSGEATFAGYVKLDDTATWLAMTDRMMEHGRSISGLPPSTYELTLGGYLATGYPTGSFLPLGIGHLLVREDNAWLFQPTLASYAAMLALSMDSLLRRAVVSPRLRALCSFLAAQPALLFGYALWGGIKEVATAWLLVLAAAVLPGLLRLPREAGWARSSRPLLPLATVAAATLAVGSLGSGVWLAPLLLGGALAIALGRGLRAALVSSAVFAGAVVVLAFPTVLEAGTFLAPLEAGGRSVFRAAEELGNLIAPLDLVQLFGIWPSGDFRVEPEQLGATRLLIAALVAAAVAGLVWAAGRGAWNLLLYVGGASLGCLVIVAFGSPWVDGKALAIASPAWLLGATAGAAGAWERGRRVEGAVAAGVLALGVLWSTALAYHEVYLAPRSELSELEEIGELTAGEGPTLMTEYNPYGARHFLRRAAPEAVSELRHRTVPLRDGEQVPKGEAADIDALALEGLFEYRTLVLRRSPVGSRPPSAYRRVWRGGVFEVWQRPPEASAPLEHLPLGDAGSAGGSLSCSELRELARRAEPESRLATVAREQPIVLPLGAVTRPAEWQAVAGNPSVVLPISTGTLSLDIRLAAGGEYDVWLGGAVRGRVEVEVDGRPVGDARHRLSYGTGYLELGSVALGAGPHRIGLRYEAGGLHPGSGGQGTRGFAMGPLVLAASAEESTVEYVPLSEASTLCGRRLDWVEAVAAG